MRTTSKWVALGVGAAAQTAGTLYLYGLPYLLPALRQSTGMSLVQLGLVVACPSIGMVAAVLGWGVLADRYGERMVIVAGLGAGGPLLTLAGFSDGITLGLLLVLAGAAGSAIYAASGRLVVGWFEPGQRGLAMGIRQASQPFGVALAAAMLPWLAETWGTRTALLVPAALCVLAAGVTALLLADAPRQSGAPGRSTGASPYQRRSPLWSVHAVAALLVAGQLTVGAFAFDYLVLGLGWAPTSAGALLAVAQLVGGVARIAAGRWSDRVGGALRPLRRLAIANAVSLAAVGLTAGLDSWVSPWLLAAAIVVTVSWHGVGYAAVAELADTSWAGRVLSAQTVVQNLASSITPPVMGALVAGVGYAAGFGAAALFPLAAAFITPLRRGLSVSSR